MQVSKLWDMVAAFADAITRAQGEGGSEVEITSGHIVAEDQIAGPVVSRVQVPNWAARSWNITMGAPRFTGAGKTGNGVIVGPLGFTGTTDAVYPAIGTQGLIKWGMGGAQHQALVDWGNGGAVQVHGSYVELDAISPASWTLPAGVRVFVAGSIAPATTSARQAAPPTLSTPDVLIAAGATQIFLVPPYAKSVAVQRSGGPNNFGTIECAFFRSAAPANAVFFEVTNNGAANMMASRAAERMFRVPANASVFTLRNLDVFDATYHLEWDIQLG
jgi:hypothetical protein